MERSDLIRDFLTTRRARLGPTDVGLPEGPRRRVKGLRREEVAMLAGVSVDYYVQIERGRSANVSRPVLDAIAGVLRLDPVEKAHLYTLVEGEPYTEPPPSPLEVRVPDSTRALVEAMDGVAVIVLNARLDVLLANAIGRALYAPAWEDPSGPNLARHTFLHPDAREFLDPWEESAESVVAMLLQAVGADPRDTALQQLVADLRASPAFVQLWNGQDVEAHYRGRKTLRADTGPLPLNFEVFLLPDLAGLSITTYIADAGSPEEKALLALGQ